MFCLDEAITSRHADGVAKGSFFSSAYFYMSAVSSYCR
jgi:hypothetical protein